jgi:signal transduction histidine kinase
MEERLERALARFVLEEQHDAVVVLERDGSVIAVNASARTLEPEVMTLVGRGDADARFATFLDDLRASGRSCTLAAGTGERVYRLEGAAVEGRFVVLVREVSAGREGEEELMNLRARASIGLVAASLLHDFNNLLTPILLLSSRLAREVREGASLAMARLIHSSAAVAASLTRDVLALARPRAPTPTIEQIDVNDVLYEMQPLAERLLGDDVELVLALDPTCRAASLDRRHFEHALLNLVVNARDALRDGGRVTIRSGLVEQSGRTHVLISVADTGVGMTPEVHRHAFDSFFTTKASTGGLGLGLSSVRRFVRECGGDVSIESAPQKGTTVTLLFDPAGARSPSEQDARTTAVESAAESEPHEAVLVVDGDTRVREAVRLALEAHGYTVALAWTQQTALERTAEEPIRVALIEDRLMRPDPKCFLHQLRALRPDLRFVLMTDSVVGSLDGGITMVSKAFSDSELLRAVKQVMESAPRSSRHP